MKTLFEQSAVHEIFNRLDLLTPATQSNWGKMSVDQMLAHCTAAMQVATGEKFPPRLLIGRVLGPFIKPSYLGPKPFPKNSPTDKSFIIADNRDFEVEKERLKNIIQQFYEGGTANCTHHPHSFFGYLTAEEWGTAMYKHLDHHLRQFGV